MSDARIKTVGDLIEELKLENPNTLIVVGDRKKEWPIEILHQISAEQEFLDRFGEHEAIIIQPDKEREEFEREKEVADGTAE